MHRGPARPFLLVAVLVLAGTVRAQEPPRNVIMIGWDGAQRDHVRESLARGDLPTLQHLAETGRFVGIEIEGTTDTKAGWSEILTGCGPQQTGVWSNRRYGPIPAGLTIFERLEAHFGAEGVVTLAVIGKKGHVDADPPGRTRVKAGERDRRGRPPEGEIVEEEGVRWRVVPGKPYHLTRQNMDLFENGLRFDEAVGRRALELLEANRAKRFFLFVHFAEVDHAGHAHGENSAEYDAALRSNDHWTGRILSRLQELGLEACTRVYVTADHGFDEGKKGHRDAPHVFLATNDLALIRGGYRRDITPTMLDALGLDLDRLRPPLDGASLRRPASPAREATARPAWIDAARDYALPRWFDGRRVCAHTRLGPPWREREVFADAGARLATLGFRVLCRHVKSGAEGAWWPSAVGRVEAWAAERDVAREIIDETHASGLRMLAYYRHSEDAWAAREHPAWVCRTPDGSVARGARGAALCLNTAYADFVLTRLLELADRGADGFYFDHVHMPKEGCWCATCRERFTTATGLQPPATANARERNAGAWLAFRNATIERAFLRWRAALHERNPELVLLVSSNTWPSLLERHTTNRLYRVADSVKTEFRKGPVRLDGGSDASLAFGWDLARDAADGRPAHVWVHGLRSHDEALAATAAIVAHGCIANLDHAEASIPDATLFADAAGLGSRAGAVLAGARPLRWALVHAAEAARDTWFPDDEAVRRHVVWPAFGAYRALLRARLPVGFVTDSQLEEGLPPECRVLFLPVAGALSDLQRSQVAAFRARGGQVIVQKAAWRWQEEPGSAAAALVAEIVAEPPARVQGGTPGMHACFYRAGGRLILALCNDASWVRTGRQRADEAPPAPPAACDDVCVRFAPPWSNVEDGLTGRPLDPSQAMPVEAFPYLALLVAGEGS